VLYRWGGKLARGKKSTGTKSTFRSNGDSLSGFESWGMQDFWFLSSGLFSDLVTSLEG